jgi:hypothetical protein
MTGNNKQLAGGLLAVAVLIVVGFLAYSMLNAPDNRGTGERLDDAVNELTSSDGRGVGEKLDDAAGQLGDRTPAEKAGDAIKDVGRDIENAVK